MCLEPMRVLEQVHRNAVVMLSREIMHEMMQKARTMFAWADIPKELFKTLYDAQPKIMAEIIAKNGKATTEGKL